jgi:hypothetical protein
MAKHFPVQLMTVPLLACVVSGAASADRTHATDDGAFRAAMSVPVCVTAALSPAEAQWVDAPGVNGAQFAVVWDVQFQTYDILWANRTRAPLQLRFVTDSIALRSDEVDGKSKTRLARRELGPREVESLPGATVVPSQSSKSVCVRTLLTAEGNR